MSEFPKNKKWDKIVSEAFSSDDEHIFSPRYNSRKYAMIRGKTMKRNTVGSKNRSNSRRLALSVVAAAAAFTLVPAGIFAAGHMGGGTSSPMTNIGSVQEPTTTDAIRPTEEVSTLADVAIEPMNLVLGYVPEELEWQDVNSSYAGKYKDANGGGMSTELYTVGNDTSFVEANFIWDTKEYDLEGKHVIIRYARSVTDSADSPDEFSRFIFVHFTEQRHVAVLHITNNYSEDEIERICEGMQLVPSEGNVKSEWRDSFPTDSSTRQYDPSVTVDMSRIELLHIGDTFTNEWLNEIAPDNACSITLNNAWIQDTFEGINTDTIGRYGMNDFAANATDENGRLKDCVRTWYSATPNGIPNGAIASENVKKHLLVVDLTYTNITDGDIDVCVSPDLFSVDGSKFTPVSWVSRNGADEVSDSYRLGCDNSNFVSFYSDKKGSKNSVVLSRGESANVRLSFGIEDDDIGHLYYGAQPCNNTDEMKNYYNSPIVDLTELKID